MENYVYLLLSEKDLKTYLGSTDNLERRLHEHNRGKSLTTKNRRPLKLIYTEKFNSLLEARYREKYLKSRGGRKELKIIFEKLDLHIYNK
jgi:putative endonuclease